MASIGGRTRNGTSVDGSNTVTEIFTPNDSKWRTGPRLPSELVAAIKRGELTIMDGGGGEMLVVEAAGDAEGGGGVWRISPNRKIWAKQEYPDKVPHRGDYVSFGIPDHIVCG